MVTEHEWTIDIGRGEMVCGYCGVAERFAAYPVTCTLLKLGHLKLTGAHSLGIGQTDGRLVVLAEAQHLSGKAVQLPHLCEQIPHEVRARYADEIRAVLDRQAAAAHREVG